MIAIHGVCGRHKDMVPLLGPGARGLVLVACGSPQHPEGSTASALQSARFSDRPSAQFCGQLDRLSDHFAKYSPQRSSRPVLSPPPLPDLPHASPPTPVVRCTQSDIAAGLSVATMVVPQGLSYAKLAGLPSVWGLYGAFTPCIVYGAFGSSKQLVRRALR